jgi:hypothetical protein
MLTGTESILKERRQTHGEFWLNARITEQLIDVLRSSPHWLSIPYETRNALTMTCCKMSRLVNDKGHLHEDNYADIIGYTQLALTATRGSKEFIRELEKEGHFD